MLELKELFSYALGGTVPQGFFDHLLNHRDDWDETYHDTLDSLAYELMPDKAVWELAVAEDGKLRERRLSLLDTLMEN